MHNKSLKKLLAEDFHELHEKQEDEDVRNGQSTMTAGSDCDRALTVVEAMYLLPCL